MWQVAGKLLGFVAVVVLMALVVALLGSTIDAALR